MRKHHHRVLVERLEDRLQLSVSFVDSGQDFGGELMQTVEFGDLDSDGDVDAFLGQFGEPNRVLLNDGRGRFVDTGQRLDDAYSVDVGLGDLDDDGDLDAIVANSAYIQVGPIPPEFTGGLQIFSRVWLNDGQGNFSDSGLRFSHEVDGNTHDIEIADLDDDGDIDVVLSGYPAGLIYLNDGQGVLTNAQQIDRDNNDAALGDLDGDDDIDIAANWLPGTNDGEFFGSGTFGAVYFNDNTGSFTSPGKPVEGRRRAFSWDSVTLGDVDADGDLDVLAGPFRNGNSPAVFVFLNDGRGNFTEGDSTLVPRFQPTLGDLDADGDLDAIVTRISSDDLRNGPGTLTFELWLNDGQGRFDEQNPVPIFELEVSSRPIPRATVEDVDNDGDLDLVAGGQLWLNSLILPNDLRPGDANGDRQFDQQDIILVLQANKYLSAESATWAEGDWNRDGVFDQLDIVAALQTGTYLEGHV